MTAERAGGTLKVHWRKGERQGANLSIKLLVNKHRKDSEDQE
jgi:hypothetical protein